MKRCALLVALLLACASGSDAKLLRFFGTSSGGTPFTPTGAPVLITAPAFSAALTNTQTTTNGAFVGNTVTTSTGTWGNCSSGCTYRYQTWYNNAPFPVADGDQTNTYTLPNGQSPQGVFPVISSEGPDSFWTTVVATNGSGSTLASTPITVPTYTYHDQVGGGTIVNCTDIYSESVSTLASSVLTFNGTPTPSMVAGQSIDGPGLPHGMQLVAKTSGGGSPVTWTVQNPSDNVSNTVPPFHFNTLVYPPAGTSPGPTPTSSTACATTRAVDNTLAIGDWLTFAGETVIFNPSSGGSIGPFYWTYENTGAPGQGQGLSQSSTYRPHLLQTAEAAALIRANIRVGTNLGGTFANLGSSFPIGPVAQTGGTIIAPVAIAVPVLTEAPTQPTVNPTLIPYVGFSLASMGTYLPGNYQPIPWNVTTQWMYCSTAAESGVPAACGAAPVPVQYATNSIAFTTNPTNGLGQTITIDGSVWTFVATITSGLQLQIGTTLANTLALAGPTLNNSTDPNTSLIQYVPSLTAIAMTTAAYGTAGNAYTLATNVPGATVAHALFTGGTFASGASLTGTTIFGATGIIYNLTSVDVGKSFFPRVTAYNTGGTVVQDGIPSLPTQAPVAPAVVVNPVIQGYPVVGDSGGGPGGALIISTSGTIAGPASSYSSVWYSCPSGSPTCTTVGAGPTTQFAAAGAQSFTYALQPATDVVGNTVRLVTTASNVTGSIPAPSVAVTVANLSETPLPAGNLGVYPAGRDPLAAYNCAPAPTTWTNTWYYDNSLGTNGNGLTAATAFNTYAHAKAAAHPGDRILLEGTPAWNANPGTAGFYNDLNIIGSNFAAGATPAFITIAADTATSAHPMTTGFSRSLGTTIDRGWVSDGLWLKSQGSLQFDQLEDFIFKNGQMGYYPDPTTALADYTANCISATCSYSDAGKWFAGQGVFPGHVGSAPLIRNGAVCQAWTGNHFIFSATGVSTGPGATDILIENNITEFFTVDAYDMAAYNPVIYHKNLIANPFDPGAHQDAFQTLPNFGTFSVYGLEVDSNKVIRFTPDATPMLTFVDTKWCTANGVSPCTSTSSQFLGGSTSCFLNSGLYFVGFRFVNNSCINTVQMDYSENTLATITNNLFLGDNFYGETSDSFNYLGNNASNTWGCFRALSGNGPAVFKNNTVLNGGSQGANCPAGSATSDTSGVDPFTDAYPTVDADGHTQLTVDPNFNGIPPGPSPGPASSLYKTGLGASGPPTNFPPTVTINGTTSTSPPNVAPY